MTWRPSLGAWLVEGGVRFRVWAPRAKSVEVLVEGAGGARPPVGLVPEGPAHFAGVVPGARPGDRYRYRVDGEGPWPDPASRAQSDGVHGASLVVDPGAFRWSDRGWSGVPLESLVLYELHVGTFTPEGTFEAAAGRLEALRDLGVTAVELMPLADFPGSRNWGYDGASLFAPARCYGPPDALRGFVDRAHALGLAVHLDVVFNHLGPDGAYLAAFAPTVFSKVHRSPWGAGINLDGEGSADVREFFIECAQHWIHEYHLDGLRIDATHAMVDDGPRHFLAEFAARVREHAGERGALLIAEDARNLAHIVRAEADGGWGMDAVWADDFHHQMRRILAGDAEGYFADFTDRVEDLAVSLRRGWFYAGQHAAYFGAPRGTDPAGLEARRFVFFLQNHDQIGNRARGDRLHHAVPLPAVRAATALLLCAPQTPLLFMGQEWGATAPFQFFTDHAGELGELVRQGRAREFDRFPSFVAAGQGAGIPDPQAPDTFTRSVLDWEERARAPHEHLLRLHRDLLELRRSDPALTLPPRGEPTVLAAGDDSIVMARSAPGESELVLVARLRGEGEVAIPEGAGGASGDSWESVLDTEEAAYAPDPRPIEVAAGGAFARVIFRRPGAILLRREREA